MYAKIGISEGPKSGAEDIRNWIRKERKKE
jgi:hypothetical protein